MKHYIGLDIGGTKCTVVLGRTKFHRTNGESLYSKPDLIAKKTISTADFKTPELTLPVLIKQTEQILKKANLEYSDIESIGISCGGPIDSSKGIILSPPNLPGWDRVEIMRIISCKTGCSVYLQNDANACALAEWKWGAGAGYDNIIFLTFGTGFGAGLILGGKLYTGTNDMAGEIGHVRISEYGPAGFGKSGSIEGFCSGTGISQIAYTEIAAQIQQGKKVSFCDTLEEARKITAKTVCEAARNGDQIAQRILDISGRYLGEALSIMIDVLNPQKIIIGSIFYRCRDLLESSLLEILNSESLPRSLEVCSVEPAVLGEEIGNYAGIAVAAEGLLKEGQENGK